MFATGIARLSGEGPLEANIMVTKTGAQWNAMVLDFGLGGFERDAEGWSLPRLTATRELLGTPSYAAPEQLRSQRRNCAGSSASARTTKRRRY